MSGHDKSGSKTHKMSIKSDKKGRRSFAGERGSLGGKAVTGKKGGSGGAYNWGSGLEYDEPFYAEDYDYDEDEGWADSGASSVPKSNTIQQKAAAAKARRQAQLGEVEAQEAEYRRVAALKSSKSAWGQQGRLDTLKQKLLQKEMDRINSMSPDRLELLSILDEAGVQLDAKTIDALLTWKRS